MITRETSSQNMPREVALITGIINTASQLLIPLMHDVLIIALIVFLVLISNY